MPAARIPDNETQRLEALRSYDILDTLPEPAFDDLTRIAGQICGVPVSLISLIDEERQWFKSTLGTDLQGTPRDPALCAHTILGDELVIVPDLREDPRFFDNPLVTDAPEIRFYAGTPLKTPDGYNIGSLCVIDRNPGELDEKQAEALRALGRQVVDQFELRKRLHTIQSEVQAREAAERAADAANRAKSAFLANMSHEIRTPLTAIIGFADQLVAGRAADDLERGAWTGMISSSGRHLLALINDILDLSKVEAGKMVYEQLPTDPRQILRELVTTLRQRAQENGLTLRLVQVGPIPQQITSDPTRFRQALTNLVGNAIKFTQDGEVCLTVSMDRDEKDNTLEGRLKVTVRDTGRGIERDKLQAIFDPFGQADASVNRTHGGTGLGLTISRQIAQGLGGDLTVDSELGQGSTFSFSVATGDLTGVPMLRPDDQPDAGPAPGSPAAAGGPALAGRILVVDDAPTNQVLLPAMLRTLGLESVVAGDGQQAVDKLAEEAFDLVLMDMHMPVMDGYTATQTLRQRGTKTPVIALTASAMKGDREACLDAGCDGYLAKPIEPTELTALLARHLSPEAVGG